MIELNHEIRIEKEPQVIWGYLTNISNWGRWARVIKHAAIYGPLRPGTEFKCIAGKWDFAGNISALESGRNISFSAKSIGLRISLNWTLSPITNTTNISLNTHIDGWIAALFPTRIRDGFDESIRIWLNSLKIAAEQGKLLPVENSDDDDSDISDNRTVQFTDSFSFLFRRKKPRP